MSAESRSAFKVCAEVTEVGVDTAGPEHLVCFDLPSIVVSGRDNHNLSVFDRVYESVFLGDAS